MDQASSLRELLGTKERKNKSAQKEGGKRSNNPTMKAPGVAWISMQDHAFFAMKEFSCFMRTVFQKEVGLIDFTIFDDPQKMKDTLQDQNTTTWRTIASVVQEKEAENDVVFYYCGQAFDNVAINLSLLGEKKVMVIDGSQESMVKAKSYLKIVASTGRFEGLSLLTTKPCDGLKKIQDFSREVYNYEIEVMRADSLTDGDAWGMMFTRSSPLSEQLKNLARV